MKTTTSQLTIGIDLGDRKHAVCIINQEGDIVLERSIFNDRESVAKFSKEIIPKLSLRWRLACIVHG